jgi:hypothetical protein
LIHMNTKRYAYLVAAITAVSLSGCVSASKITPAGNGTYVIQARGMGPWNSDKERKRALTKASDYCGRQSKRVVLHSIDESGHAVLLTERAEITFECES